VLCCVVFDGKQNGATVSRVESVSAELVEPFSRCISTGSLEPLEE